MRGVTRPGNIRGEMRTWIFKTDEDGKPRRFLSHREAAMWTASRVGAFFGLISVFGVARAIYEAFTSPSAFERQALIMILISLAVIWLGVCAVVYLYIVLSGGVMSRAERERRERTEALPH